MATMNVSLPDPMKAWVEDQVAEGRFGNSSDYVRDLIRRDQDAQAGVRALQAAIDEGLASGISPRSLDDILTQARTRAEKAAPHEG